VDAIFTPAREQRDARFVVGLMGIVAGIALWTTVILYSLYPTLFGASEISFYLSMVLSTLGLTLVISGAGICLTYSIFRPVYEGSVIADTESVPMNRAVLSDDVTALQDHEGPQAGIRSSYNMRFGLFAFIMSSVILVLYSGMADEYQSNSSMRKWVSSVFPYGQLVLSWEAVLVSAVFLGLIVVQFLPGRALAE
jgi:hypothetical protein